jgi:hypothetical protein
MLVLASSATFFPTILRGLLFRVTAVLKRMTRLKPRTKASVRHERYACMGGNDSFRNPMPRSLDCRNTEK